MHWLSGAFRAMFADLATFAPIVASLGAVDVLAFRFATRLATRLATRHPGAGHLALRNAVGCGAEALRALWLGMRRSELAAGFGLDRYA